MGQRNGVEGTRRTIYRGRIFTVTTERVRLPHGREVDMEIVRHPGSVVLLPMPDPEHLILVRQYRYVIDRWIWELPAGSVDDGESFEAAAARECREEIGLAPGRVERIAAFYPTPGYCDEQMVFFRLTNLMRLPADSTGGGRDEDENLEPRVFAFEDARQLAREGEIVDLKTAVGLTLI